MIARMVATDRKVLRIESSFTGWVPLSAGIARRPEVRADSMTAVRGCQACSSYLPKLGEPVMYHGYAFRVIKAQGRHVTGGARDYVVRGLMIGGFALVAYPVDYACHWFLHLSPVMMTLAEKEDRAPPPVVTIPAN
jgi:hypothetical protein